LHKTQRTYTQLLDGIIVLLLDTNHNRKADAIQLLEYDGSVKVKNKYFTALILLMVIIVMLLQN